MPINNNLQKVNLPTSLQYGKSIQTKFEDHLSSINVQLTQYSTIQQLKECIPDFCTATWAQQPLQSENLSEEEKLKIIYGAFTGKYLPTALEVINFTFMISGVDTQFVTHLLRHRTFSFSAQCTGDRSQRSDTALIPRPILNSPEFLQRYKDIVNQSKQLYADMIDSKKISIMDARHILPKCLSTFYYVKGTAKDWIAFIKQRIDKQIQPTQDNVVAYYAWLEILSVYPFLVNLIDIHTPAYHYIKTARLGTGTNLYFPDKDSDIFEYNENDFLYQGTRSQINGTQEGQNTFDKIFESIEKAIDEFKNEYNEKYKFLES